MSAKKSPLAEGHEEEHENSERWLLTYSDMMTLLVAFFIMLYSMSVVNLAKFARLAVSVRSGFNGEAKGGGGPSMVDKGQVNALGMALHGEPSESRAKSVAPLMSVGDASKPVDSLSEIRKEVEKAIQEAGMRGMVKGKMTREGYAVVMMGDGVFFADGSPELSAEARKLLRKIALALNHVDGKVSVEGYTQSLGANSSYATRWDLSTARSLNVVKYFADEGGVDPTRLSATGFGERRPGETPETGDFVRILVRSK